MVPEGKRGPWVWRMCLVPPRPSCLCIHPQLLRSGLLTAHSTLLHRIAWECAHPSKWQPPTMTYMLEFKFQPLPLLKFETNLWCNSYPRAPHGIRLRCHISASSSPPLPSLPPSLPRCFSCKCPSAWCLPWYCLFLLNQA